MVSIFYKYFIWDFSIPHKILVSLRISVLLVGIPHWVGFEKEKDVICFATDKLENILKMIYIFFLHKIALPLVYWGKIIGCWKITRNEANQGQVAINRSDVITHQGYLLLVDVQGRSIDRVWDKNVNCLQKAKFLVWSE